MSNRQESLLRLLNEAIYGHLREIALDNIIQNSERDPNGTLGDTGAVKVLLSNANRLSG